MIRTHNILTSHNQTHKNAFEPIKKCCIPSDYTLERDVLAKRPFGQNVAFINNPVFISHIFEIVHFKVINKKVFCLYLLRNHQRLPVLDSSHQTHFAKNALLLWVRLSQQVTSEKSLLELCWIIFLIYIYWFHNWRHHFFFGLLISFYIQWQRQHLFWATVEEKTISWWHQVHKQTRVLTETMNQMRNQNRS